MLALFLVCVLSSTVLSLPSRFEVTSSREETTTELSNRVTDYIESRVNEVASVSCDVCLKAVYGINYNVIRLKKAAEDAVKLDCEALFHGQAEDISKCIRVLIQKIEQYYNKVEPVLDTRHVCVKMRMCAPVEKKKYNETY